MLSVEAASVFGAEPAGPGAPLGDGRIRGNAGLRDGLGLW
ncbi:Uncharacterised protein [Mycobacterium tuberculosis]|uniref:Uncharacterized protein n=1 Tax=Mycobacterium tuberculosis TaxID=1773 RepID=A0A654TZ66_MYCTX|nr:Uncharacterised protein [Mycobacterium tuberculosis]CKR01255.1 Uncharacterised protein [Mycobacterium tuberculosis]CKT68629.1 Uncharacterised protein [Mycobacterium tuberculosis]CKW42415.1 Uncharacterised protein [Mycobacterium tuberculosis]COX83830.1 Uncharacterised protein [Mycobacterium tuberculosis]